MSAVEKTNCPFTLTEYRQLLRLAKTRFPLVGYSNYKQHESFVIWRHDVEYSVRQMSVLARIDAEEDVRSTLFVQLHSELYNFWDKETVAEIKQWVALGHDLGLHFDCGYYGDDAFRDMARLLLLEKSLLEDIFDTPIRSFAYHNPSNEILQHQADGAGLINAYNSDFLSGAIIYVSDSNGRWRERTIRDVLEDPDTRRAQVNTHDTWWTDQRIPQIEKLEAAILAGAHEKIANYRQHAHVVVDDVI